MDETSTPVTDKHSWVMRVLASLGLGALGACLGFGAGFGIALALTQNSSAAVAGGGDGVDALIALCFVAGLVGAGAGGVGGVWLGWSVGQAEPLYGLKSQQGAARTGEESRLPKQGESDCG
jgi:hypothetical protein